MTNNTTATETPTRHFHCGFDCYQQHRYATSRCAHIGHFDIAERCTEDCAQECAHKRATLGI